MDNSKLHPDDAYLVETFHKLDPYEEWKNQRDRVILEKLHIAESDPTGRTPHEPGAKLDHGKNRLGLVLHHGFPRALQAVGDVGTYGATKYSPNGWKSVPDGAERYLDAMYRHLLADATGENIDQDTGLLHLAHAAWNLLAILELRLKT